MRKKSKFLFKYPVNFYLNSACCGERYLEVSVNKINMDKLTKSFEDREVQFHLKKCFTKEVKI